MAALCLAGGCAVWADRQPQHMCGRRGSDTVTLQLLSSHLPTQVALQLH